MQQFIELIESLENDNSTNAKVRALANYFSKASEEDQLWTLALFSGRRPKKSVTSGNLRQWAAEASGIPEWLFQECYQFCGDLAETIAHLVENETGGENRSLTEIMYWVQGLATLTIEEKKEQITAFWKNTEAQERFIIGKFLTGGFRMGISSRLVMKGFAQAKGLDINEVTLRLTGNWEPTKTSLKSLLEGDSVYETSKPYPFFLASPIEEEFWNCEPPEKWQAEWKWDGIRGQIVKRNSEIHIWSRGEEPVTDKFPELVDVCKFLPDGTVLDGEILAFKENEILPFQKLQARINRKKLGSKILKDSPVSFFAYDILEWQGESVRHLSLKERRILLEALLSTEQTRMLLSPTLPFENWGDLRNLRANARAVKAEGLMLKKLDSVYEIGRKKGAWWKWKLEPYTIDAVMIYAQTGHGRRANLFTDFTFAVWQDERLVPFTKAYSGLTDKELKEVDAFVKKNTIERFGPVRSVHAELVMEIGFEGIQKSARHKSGVALRFPRIIRWRKDKKPKEADHLSTLLNILDNNHSL